MCGFSTQTDEKCEDHDVLFLVSYEQWPWPDDHEPQTLQRYMVLHTYVKVSSISDNNEAARV